MTAYLWETITGLGHALLIVGTLATITTTIQRARERERKPRSHK